MCNEIRKELEEISREQMKSFYPKEKGYDFVWIDGKKGYKTAVRIIKNAYGCLQNRKVKIERVSCSLGEYHHRVVWWNLWNMLDDLLNIYYNRSNGYYSDSKFRLLYRYKQYKNSPNFSLVISRKYLSEHIEIKYEFIFTELPECCVEKDREEYKKTLTQQGREEYENLLSQIDKEKDKEN